MLRQDERTAAIGPFYQRDGEARGLTEALIDFEADRHTALIVADVLKEMRRRRDLGLMTRSRSIAALAALSIFLLAACAQGGSSPSSSFIAPSSAQPATAQVRGGGNCNPSYPTVCIPPPPPDLDCGDLAFSNFEVLAPGPHNFDSDGDGIGCESSG